MPYYWFDVNKNRASTHVGFCLGAAVEVTEEELEELVECVRCDCKVPVDLATSHDAGWVCDECREDC